MLRLLTMCIPFRNLRKKGRAFLRDFLSDYDRNARRSMRAWRRHAVAGRTILILEPNYCHGEVLPGFCRHLLDMGYRVDVLMHHSLAGQSPLCCFKENEIQIFTAMCTSWKRLAKAPVLNRYEAILVSTSAFYDTPGWAGFLHMTGLDRFTNLLAVEHELNDIPRFGEEGLERQGRLLTLGSFPKGTMVNPHFFGEIPPAPRNREPVFITVGSLSAQRKNHNLLIEALQTIYHEGHRDFSVIIVGEGELGEIPGHLRPFLHVAGKLDFPAMYEAMRRADYFLPLLDPGNPAHDRYITTGITGSALLIYGFAKIPVIHEKFAWTLAAPPHYREETDWITAIHSEKGQARILLIGDSVMRHLWRPLASELQEDIDLFSSTLIPGDPDYLPTLAGYFPSAGYEAVIVSFGSHVTNKVSAISVDDFRKNYMAFVSQLSKRCRFLILATSTSIMDGPDGTLNEEKEKTLAAFNAIVREAASSLPGAVLSDHHGFMQGRRYRSLPFLPSGPRVPGRENSRTAPAPSLRPAGTAKGTGMSENPPRTMKWTNERKPPNYFPYGEKRLPPAKIPAPAFKDFKFPPFFKLQTSLFRPERSLHALSLPGLFLPAAPSSRPFP